MSGGIRLGVVGATGILGREFIHLLETERLEIEELRLFAGDRSLGEDVDFRGDVVAIQSPVEELRGLDAVVLCTPAEAALDLVRVALRSEVACLDCSGVLAGSAEVPLAVADLGAHDGLAAAPLISSPPGPALLWAPVLTAIQREAGLRRVIGSVLHSASSAGRAGIDALSERTLALLNQREAPEGELFPGLLAFDCLVHVAPEGTAKDGTAAVESQMAEILRRLLGPDIGIAVTSVNVPTFAGQGASLVIETERPITPERAASVLAASPGIDVMDEGDALGTRDSVGRDEVIVARLRADPSAPDPGCGLMAWLAGDPVRLAAGNAIKLLRARFPAA